jgi:hypothetical protein
MSEFLKLDNLKGCEARFRAFMLSKHGIAFESDEDTDKLRRLLYGVMQDVSQASTGDESIRALNNATLNAAREAVLDARMQSQSSTAVAATMPMLARPAASPPHAHAHAHAHAQMQMQSRSQSQLQSRSPNLPHRDRDVYGEREVRFQPFADPDATRLSMVAEDGDVYERAEKAREDETRVVPPVWNDVGRPTQAIGAMDASEFENRLADLASQRGQLMPPPTGQAPPPPPATTNPQRLLADHPLEEGVLGGSPPTIDPRAFPEASDGDDLQQFLLGRRQPPPLRVQSQEHASRADLLIPAPKLTQTVVKYLAVNGADRDIVAHPYRFQFTVKTGGRQSANSMQGTYSDVSWLEATRIILPMEVVQATGSVVMPKGFYNLAYSFAYPYVMLMIDGFDDIYDGSNDLMRRAFCTFIYDNDYKGPNGRGYVMLRPAQKERKNYTGAPLGTLPNLKLSIVKPNGTLFNNSRDAYTVSSLIYEPQNRLLIKVIVDQFFDRNEYWVGDMVNLSGMKMSVTASASNDGMSAYVASLQAYLTRREGFEIVQLATSNQQGFYNAFYVLAPGVLDQTHGQVIVDQNMVGVVAALVEGSVAITAPARLLNASLQPVVTMRVGCLRGAI